MKIKLLRPHSSKLLQNILSHSFSPFEIPAKGKFKNPVEPYLYAEAVVEAVHEPILILNKTLTILSANKAFYKTFKLTKKRTLSRNFTEFTKRNPQVQELIDRLQALTTQNTSFEEFEMVYKFTKGGERTLLLNAKRIFLGKHVTDFILLGIEDITKRKLIEQRKDDFVGFVTHELKTPLTAINAFIQILNGYHLKTGDKKSQFLLAKISGQMERLTNLLNSFAKVYKAQTGNLELKKERFDLNKLVREVVDAFQYATTTHSLVIQGEIERLVVADRERIHEVLINLIVNAIKYSPTADKVIIKLKETDTEIIVSVKDFGIGITKEEQIKVFERFFRVKGKTENTIEGLGLGLYLVSEILKQHKGKLWVESTVGEGSIFSFSLPIKKTHS